MSSKNENENENIKKTCMKNEKLSLNISQKNFQVEHDNYFNSCIPRSPSHNLTSGINRKLSPQFKLNNNSNKNNVDNSNSNMNNTDNNDKKNNHINNDNNDNDIQEDEIINAIKFSSLNKSNLDINSTEKISEGNHFARYNANISKNNNNNNYNSHNNLHELQKLNKNSNYNHSSHSLSIDVDRLSQKDKNNRSHRDEYPRLRCDSNDIIDKEIDDKMKYNIINNNSYNNKFNNNVNTNNNNNNNNNEYSVSNHVESYRSAKEIVASINNKNLACNSLSYTCSNNSSFPSSPSDNTSPFPHFSSIIHSNPFDTPPINNANVRKSLSGNTSPSGRELVDVIPKASPRPYEMLRLNSPPSQPTTFSPPSYECNPSASSFFPSSSSSSPPEPLPHAPALPFSYSPPSSSSTSTKLLERPPRVTRTVSLPIATKSQGKQLSSHFYDNSIFRCIFFLFSIFLFFFIFFSLLLLCFSKAI